jgi:hypothetical protein
MGSITHRIDALVLGRFETSSVTGSSSGLPAVCGGRQRREEMAKSLRACCRISGIAEAATPLEAYLTAQTNRAMRTLHCVDRSPTAHEEIFATIRHQYLAQAGEFRPGADIGDGMYRSYGYAAFHERFLPKAWNAIAKNGSAERFLQRLPGRDDEHQSWSDRVDARARDVDRRFTHLNLIGFSSVLADSLRAALREATSWDVFHAMIYRGETASSLATRLAVSQGHISDAITNKILGVLRLPLASFYDCASPRRIRITELREPLRDILSESDFLALVPRPLPSLPRRLDRAGDQRVREANPESLVDLSGNCRRLRDSGFGRLRRRSRK